MTNSTLFALRRTSWVLVVIILLGTALRFINLGGQSIWYDEAVSLAIANRLSLWGILANQGESSHPPLYYLLLRVWTNWAGINDFTARVPSAGAGILTIPIIYLVGREIIGRRAGLWSAFFIAVFPFHVYYAQEARMYTLLALLTTLSLLFFLKAVKHNRWQIWGIYWLCLALGFYTHYFIVFVILVYHLYLLLNWRRHYHLWKAILITDSLLLLVFLPQVVTFLDQSREVLAGYWLGKPSLLAFFTTIYFFIASFTVPFQLTFIGLFVTLSWLAIGSYEVYRNIRSTQTLRHRFYLLCLGAFLPLVIVLAISQVRPIFLERTLIICTPFLVLLLAWTLTASRRRSPVPYLSGILSVLLVISLYRFYFDPSAQKPPLRLAAAQINMALEPNDMVVHTSVGSFMPFLFYQPPAEHYLLWGDPDARKSAKTFELFGGRIITRDNIAGHGRLWLVVELDHSIDYQRDQVSWFDERFSLIDEMEIGGIFVRLYNIPE